MIAVSIEVKDPIYKQLRHFALPPIMTDDFNAARDITQNYMNKVWPNCFYTVHMCRHDWTYSHIVSADEQTNHAMKQQLFEHKLN